MVLNDSHGFTLIFIFLGAIIIFGMVALISQTSTYVDNINKSHTISHDNSTEVWSNGDYTIEVAKVNDITTCYILNDDYNGDIGISCVVNK